MYEQSHRDYLRSVIWQPFACHGLLIITVITPLPTKPSATKMPEKPKLANAAITDMQMRQRDVAAPDAKYTKELADAKAENDALRDDVAAGRRRLRHQSSLSVSARNTGCLAWIMQPPPPRLADTAERDYFYPQREADRYAKTTGRNPLLNIVSRAFISMGNFHAIIVYNTHALPAEYKCLK